MSVTLLRIVYWLTTVPFLLSFGLVLVIFHPLQWIGLRIGYGAHKRVVDGMIAALLTILPLSGNRVRFVNRAGQLPKDKPMIIVSNHQSLYDIPAIGWALRGHHPKYISKDSLAKGIPSISFNIRHGGSIWINRDNKREAASKIIGFSQYLNTHNRAGCIFAEGKRAKDGVMRPFKPLGLSVMLKKMPDATIVPVALDNFWHLERYKLRPVPSGHVMTCTVLPPVDRAAYASEKELIDAIENQIRAVLGQPKPAEEA